MAIAGYGRFGRELERAAIAIGLTVAIVYDRNAAAGAVSVSGAPLTASLDEAISHPDVGAVMVVTSHESHRRISEAALRAGKHVFCEKPMATTVLDAQAMVRVAEQMDRSLLIGHVMRLLPSAIAAQEAIRDGILGAPISAVAMRANWLPRQGWWRSRHETGGMAFSPGVHTIDLLGWWLGPVIDVHAYAVPIIQEGLDYPDALAAILRFESGALASLTLSLSDGYPGGRGTDTIRIACQQGTLALDFSSPPSLVIEPRGEAAWSIDDPSGDGAEQDLIKTELRNFVDVINGDASPFVMTEAAVQAVACCEAIERSLVTGMPVRIDTVVNGLTA